MAILREAISSPLRQAGSLLVEKTYLAWLTDEDANMIWSLRLDEHDAVRT